MADRPNYLSREQMEAVLKQGGSILHNGEIITEASKLPTEADLAQGDEQRRGRALAHLYERKKGIEAEIAKLEGEPTAKQPEAPKPPSRPVPAVPSRKGE